AKQIKMGEFAVMINPPFPKSVLSSPRFQFFHITAANFGNRRTSRKTVIKPKVCQKRYVAIGYSLFPSIQFLFFEAESHCLFLSISFVYALCQSGKALRSDNGLKLSFLTITCFVFPLTAT